MVHEHCDPQSYINELKNRSHTPQGFTFYTDSFLFSPRERPESPQLRMNVSAIVSDREETRAVGMLTRNRFPGAPVLLARERLPGGFISGVVVNNRISNVASPRGYADACAVADSLARTFGISPERTLSVSTGIIGWKLPVPELLDSLPRLPQQQSGVVDFAQGIMTTDRYPKVAWRRSDGVCLTGVAKGAGMIEPNLATMLAFFMTDAVVDPAVMDRVFRRVVDGTFNTISVDSDQSTSDMVLLMANGASGIELSEDDLETMLLPVARELVEHIVRNGEGTAHVIEVIVSGVDNATLARNIGKHIVNSPLVKTAIYGNDPNVGRILAAVGNALDHLDRDGTVDPRTLSITILGELVYRDGAFLLDGDVERRLSDALLATSFDPTFHGCPQWTDPVNITVSFGRGSPTGEQRVLGSDLSYEYVRENADYRS